MLAGSQGQHLKTSVRRETMRVTKEQWIAIGITTVLLLATGIFCVLSFRSEREAPLNRTRLAFAITSAAITSYDAIYGAYPKSLQELLQGDKQGSNGLLESPDSLMDAWGQPIRYTPQSNGFELISAGPDRIFGTQDDVVWPHKEPAGLTVGRGNE